MNIDTTNTDKMAADVSKLVYYFACGIFEKLEADGKISGNGHHDAQRLSILARYLILKKTRLDRVPDEDLLKEKQIFDQFMIW